MIRQRDGAVLFGNYYKHRFEPLGEDLPVFNRGGQTDDSKAVHLRKRQQFLHRVASVPVIHDVELIKDYHEGHEALYPILF